MKCLSRCVVVASALAALAGSTSPASAIIETIYTKIFTHPTAAIPGPVDLTGAAASSEWRGIESLVMSPGGEQWMIKGRTNLGSDLENIAVIGAGRTGALFVQEGQFAPGGGASDRYEFFGASATSTSAPFGRFDTQGNFAFSGRTRNVTNGTTAPANGQRIFLWNGSSFSSLFEQTDPYTGVFDTAAAPGGGAPGNETMGNGTGSVHLLNNGTVGFHDGAITNVGFTLRPALFYNLAMFHQSGGTDTVLSLDGLSNVSFSTSTGVTAEKFNTTPNGTHWMMVGTTAGTPTRSVLVRNGQVVIENGTSPGAGAPTVGTVTNFEQLNNGHWFAWGGYAAQAGFWAVKDGVVVAKTGDPITTGSSELWGNSVYMVTGNRRGDWAIAASTNAGSTTADEVVVLNTASTSTVLARESDMVDLNNNALNDDNAFIGRGNVSLSAFINLAMGVSDDGWVYFFANIHDSGGADLGSPSFFGNPNGFFRVAFAPSCGVADFDGDGDSGTDLDIEAFFACLGGDCCAKCGSADFDGDGDAGTDLDIEAFFRVLGGGNC